MHVLFLHAEDIALCVLVIQSSDDHVTYHLVGVTDSVGTGAFFGELAQIRLTFHPGGEISDTLIGMLLDVIEHDPGYHNVFRFDSQPVYGVENVYFGLLLDVVVVLEHHVSELLLQHISSIHTLSRTLRNWESRQIESWFIIQDTQI